MAGTGSDWFCSIYQGHLFFPKATYGCSSTLPSFPRMVIVIVGLPQSTTVSHGEFGRGKVLAGARGQYADSSNFVCNKVISMARSDVQIVCRGRTLKARTHACVCVCVSVCVSACVCVCF